MIGVLLYQDLQTNLKQTSEWKK